MVDIDRCAMEKTMGVTSSLMGMLLLNQSDHPRKCSKMMDLDTNPWEKNGCLVWDFMDDEYQTIDYGRLISNYRFQTLVYGRLISNYSLGHLVGN